MTSQPLTSRYDVAEVKRATAGHWQQILSALGGIPQDFLDGRNHPCPRCGGIDRFRYLDAEAGACFCNQCFNSKNGDGLAALQWITGQDFPTVLHRVAEYACIKPSANGNGTHNGSNGTSAEPLLFQPWNDVLIALWARHKPGVTVEAVKATGGQLAMHYGTLVVALPVRNLDPHKTEPVGYMLYNSTGGELRTKQGSAKVKSSHKGPGLLVLGDLATAKKTYDVEGGTDALALWAAMSAEDHAQCAVVTNAHGASEGPQKYLEAFRGRWVAVIRDADAAGEKSGAKWTTALAGVAAQVRRFRLPYEVSQDRGRDLRDWLNEEGHTFQELSGIIENVEPVNPAAVATEQITFDPVFTGPQLDAQEFSRDFIVEDILPAGQHAIAAGPHKSLKSLSMEDLAVSAATGTPFLGHFHVDKAVRVLYMAGESGLPIVQENLRRICAAHELELGQVENLLVTDRLPIFGSATHVAAVESIIRAEELKLVIIDPAYLAIPGEDAANLFKMGELLRGMGDVFTATGATLLLIHHTTRPSGADRQPLELASIAWSGFPEFAGAWLLVSRREKYEPGSGEHRLWLNAGSRLGSGGLWAVDVSEGTYHRDTPRQWRVTVTDGREAREEAQASRTATRRQERTEQAAEKLERNQKAVVAAMVRFPAGETANILRDAAGLSGGEFRAAIAGLLKSQNVVACDIMKSNHSTPYQGYKLAEEAPCG